MTFTEGRRIIQPAAVTFPVVVTILSWGYVLTGAGTGMDLLSTTTHLLPPPMQLPTAEPAWTIRSAVLMVGMWWSMMLAMMMPGAIVQSGDRGWLPASRAIGFYAGYSLVWLAFSLAAATWQLFLQSHGWLHPMTMWSINRELSALLLFFSGIYQFLPVKRTALSCCSAVAHEPLSLNQGLSYGRHCVIASGPMMMLLYVGGVMNLYWIIGLSAVATLEKALTRPKRLIWALGGLGLVMALQVWLP